MIPSKHVHKSFWLESPKIVLMLSSSPFCPINSFFMVMWLMLNKVRRDRIETLCPCNIHLVVVLLHLHRPLASQQCSRYAENASHLSSDKILICSKSNSIFVKPRVYFKSFLSIFMGFKPLYHSWDQEYVGLYTLHSHSPWLFVLTYTTKKLRPKR